MGVRGEQAREKGCNVRATDGNECEPRAAFAERFGRCRRQKPGQLKRRGAGGEEGTAPYLQVHEEEPVAIRDSGFPCKRSKR